MNNPDFQKHAQEKLHFLVESCGFAQASSEPDRVRYTSKDVMVEVNYSGRGEVDVILDENPPSHRFQLRLFLQAYHQALDSDGDRRRDLIQFHLGLKLAF